MGRLSTIELIGRIGEMAIARFRDGTIEFLVAPDDPATLRLSVRFAAAGDRQEDLARLGEIAAATGAAVARGWATANLVAIEMAVQPQAAAEPLDRVVPFTAESRRPRLASRA
ncbi:MAG TPA: hypothetical protein VJO12_14985 [Stellaceae bacterium]|nr:hypothetical protein [Stellaceae bacterium]